MVDMVEVPRTDPVVLGFSVSHQKVQLDIDLAFHRLQGRTEITIIPDSADLKTIRLDCRQCKLKVPTVNGKAISSWSYTDPYEESMLHWWAGVHQHHMLRQRIDDQLKVKPEQELVINLPKNIKIEELDPFSIEAQSILVGRPLDSAKTDISDPNFVDLTQNTRTAVEQIVRFTPIILCVEFTIDEIRDGMHFIGWDEGELQYPHAYTRNSSERATSCLFPCLDTADSRCTWEISIKCARTIGDAWSIARNGNTVPSNGLPDNDKDDFLNFSREDQALDLVTVCSGDMTDEIIDPRDNSKKTTSFICTTAVTPQHIGFAIGPFEHVNLAEFRELDEDEKLGQNAVPVHGFCLPGRAKDLKNTCLPMAKAIDFFTLTYGSYPFSNYKVCFVDDMVQDCMDTASLSICSNRLLFPEGIIEPLDRITRQLVHALASQWVGVNIIPKEATDIWAVVGIAYFITDVFMKKLSGNNEYRFQQKKAADRVCEADVARPSIHDLGPFTHLDPLQLDFIAAKAPLVLFILDRRLAKAGGSSGLSRIISRVFLNSKVGDLANGTITTAYFMKTCEKLGHTKLDTFFNQWVFGAGCPRFRVTQRFNKKKLVVEMLIQQVQGETPAERDLEKQTFMRDVKEEHQEIFAGLVQPVFTGPMTIRIHEADGTPYEHIVEVKEATTKFDIPYNTKYKRLKRSRWQKERTVAGANTDFATDNQDDVLLYCLGDVLQSEEEMRSWRLVEWSREDEDRMSQESYEWIRMDADFEWICKMSITMPGYMYLSQLQQDRDVVAQLESVQYMAAQREHPLVSTILVRTLMDRRYFHGVRTAAATALSKHAKDEIGWLGLFHLEKAFHEFFCFSDSPMTRSNDFLDRSSYYIQCIIPRAIAKVRDVSGKAPFRAINFLFEKLRYNDNSNNEFSDCHYLATLMEALAEALASKPVPNSEAFDANEEEGYDIHFHNSCLEEIDRYRRIDQWIPSYHNILSSTALDCKRRLAKAGVITINPVDFLQYTQDSVFDGLRISAFHNLTELGMGKNYSILRWFLLVLSTDPSPYVREYCFRLFGKTLGSIAIGENTSPTNTSTLQQGGLIIEQESSTEARQADLARKQTIAGALAALKLELGDNVVLKTALWEAIESPILTLRELGELLDICALLYTPVTSALVVLKYPRYWSVTNHRKQITASKKPTHILTFTPNAKPRTTLTPKHDWSTAAASKRGGPSSPLLKRQDSTSSSTTAPTRTLLKPPKKPGASMAPPPPPQTGTQTQTSTTEDARPRKLTLKLNLKGAGVGKGGGGVG